MLCKEILSRVEIIYQPKVDDDLVTVKIYVRDI